MDSLPLSGGIKAGDSFTLEKKITEQMVRAFAELTGDFNPVHMDEKYCGEHGLGSRIVHGMLVLSYLSTLIGMHLPGNGSVWLSQDIDFILPVRIGDTVRITGTVTEIADKNILGLNIAAIGVKICNQHGVRVARGNVKVSLK